MEKHGMFAITKKYGISVIAWALFSSSGLALATEPMVFINNQIKGSGNSAAYWTAERLKNAQVPLPPKSLSQKVIYYRRENHSKTKSPQGLCHTRRSVGGDPTAAAEACHASPVGMPQKTR